MIARFLRRGPARPAGGSLGGRQGGFTLVELLVSIALLGLISVAMAGSLRFGARVWDTGADRGEWLNRAEITQNFLRQHIGQAAAARGAFAPEARTQGPEARTQGPEARTQGTEERAQERDSRAQAPDAFADTAEQAFSGAPDRLRFVAPAPVQAGVGGFSRFELFVSGDAERRDLVLSINLGDVAESGEAAPETLDARVLIDDIESAVFRYYGALEEGRDADWHDEWTDPDHLPALVALQVSFPEGDRRPWPELLIALRLGTGTAAPPQ